MLSNIKGNVDTNILVDPWTFEVGGKWRSFHGIRDAAQNALSWTRDNLQIPIAPGMFAIRPATLGPWLSIAEREGAGIVGSATRQPFITDVRRNLKVLDQPDPDLVFAGKQMFAVNWGTAADGASITPVEGNFIRLDTSNSFVQRIMRGLMGVEGGGSFTDRFFSQESIFGRARSIFTKYSDKRWGPTAFNTLMGEAEPDPEVLRKVRGMMYKYGDIDKGALASMSAPFENQSCS